MAESSVVKKVLAVISRACWRRANPMVLMAFALAMGVFESGEIHPAGAQGPEPVWAAPVNLSHSGATVNPVIVVDSASVIHVVWHDTFAAYVYARYDGTQWSQPVATNLDQLFGPPVLQPGLGLSAGSNPLLVADTSRYVHAFWTMAPGGLYASRALATQLDDFGAWSGAQLISSSAIAFAAIADGRGRLHLTYLQITESAGQPAGIYYTSSDDDGVTWRTPTLIYASQYLRSLTAGQANLTVATADAAEGPHVYVAWDNGPRRQVFFARSTDGGTTWGPAVEVDGPVQGSGTGGPSNIRVGALGNTAVLVWQTSQDAATCTQLYESSADGGDTWSQPAAMIEDLPGCAQANDFVATHAGLMFLLTNVQNQYFLSAWNGTEWSQAQAQEVLAGLQDPETFAQITLGCQRAAPSGERLYVVGCDSSGGGDIWFMSRALGDSESWFAAPSVWGKPVALATAAGGISSPALILEADQIHTLWIQPDVVGAAGQRSIFYARGEIESGRWSTPGTVLTVPGDNIGHVSAATSGDGRLLATWDSIEGGQVYFSWAKAANAFQAADWIQSQAIPVPRAAAWSPDLYTDGQDSIGIVYALAINEDRGVYLSGSLDRGTTWQQPGKVFDGAAGGWENVAAPHVVRSTDGTLHALFEKVSHPWSGKSLGLYYARSTDGGVTWTNAEVVSGSTVKWSCLLVAGDQSVYRLWQDEGGLLWQDHSTDAGQTWSREEVVSGLQSSTGMAAAAVDSSGRVHLIMIAEDLQGNLVLNHASQDGQGWRAEASLYLEKAANIQVKAVKAAASDSGVLGVVYVLSTRDSASAAPENELYFVSRQLSPADITAVATPTQAVVLSPTAIPGSPTPPTPVETPTLTPADLIQLSGQASAAQGNQNTAILVGAGLAALLVIAGFGVTWIIQRGRG